MINVAFVTNIVSRHQVDLWDCFSMHSNINFSYIYTADDAKTESRYKIKSRQYCKYSKDIVNIEKFLNEQDILIVSAGSIEDSRINNHLACCKNVIIYSEHISKYGKISTGINKFKYFVKRLVLRPKYHRNIKRCNYVLCASSHAGYDFHLTGFPKKHIYKFGYFPNLEYNENLKTKNNILFCGRNIFWKHYEDAVYAYNILKEVSPNYKLYIVGNGFDKLKIDGADVCGELNHSEATKMMFNSDIYIFSSTREEGWGVVLMEAMAAGCFVFANAFAGSTRFLIKDGYNGFIYKNKNELHRKIKKYLKLSPDKILSIRKNAVNTIKTLWNPKVASDRLHGLCVSIVNGKKYYCPNEGPLSRDSCKF